jgi:hypothetical protein
LIEGLYECTHAIRLVELLRLLHCLLLLEGNVIVHSAAGEKVVLLPLLRPRLLRVIVGVSLDVTLLNESHRLSFHRSLILILGLHLHLLSKDVSVNIVCRDGLLLESGVAIIEVTHKVGVIIVDMVNNTRTRVEIMLILCTPS